MRNIMLVFIIIGLAASPAWPAARPAAKPADRLAHEAEINFRQSWEQWRQVSSQLEAAREEMAEVQIESDPERAEQQWWNPFWRNSRQGRLQRGNELTLRIQMLDRKLRETEAETLRHAAAFSAEALRGPDTLSEQARQLWCHADEWRVAVLLREPDWQDFQYASAAAQSPEIVAQRKKALLEYQRNWQALEVYLQARPFEPERSSQAAEWRALVSRRLRQVDALLQVFRELDDAEP